MIATEVRIMKWGLGLLAVAALFVSLVVTMRAFDSMGQATDVGSATLTQATMPAPQLAQPKPISSNGQLNMSDPGQAELIPPNEAHTTSATVYIPEGSDPDKPVHAPDNAIAP